MERRPFEIPFDMDGFHSFPPKNPSHEALDITVVELRIREWLPEVSGECCCLLAPAVMALVPPPPELGEYLRKAEADLEDIRNFLHQSYAGRDEVWELLANLAGELFAATRYLQKLRDRLPRFCDHKEILSNKAGWKYCSGCGTRWRPDDEFPVVRMLTPRHKLPKRRKERDRPSSRAFFVYFIAELLRHESWKKKDALRVAGKLLRLFWGAEREASEDAIRLHEAHKEGKGIARQRRLASVDDFLRWPLDRATLNGVLIWIPYTEEANSPDEGGTP